MTPLEVLAAELSEVEALEAQIREMVAPLQQQRQALATKREEVQQAAKDITGKIDEQLRLLDRMIRAAEPPQAAAPKPSKSKAREAKIVNVSPEIQHSVMEALEKEGAPVSARDLHRKHFEGTLSDSSVANALRFLRAEGKVRHAGTGEKNAMLWALPLKAVE